MEILNCYHYEYLPFIKSDLYKPCAYCKENKKTKQVIKNPTT